MRLRKLHELAGAAVFIDEAHAALPGPLWPQTWLWIKELTRDWGCHFVFASGSLVRFWQLEEFVNPAETVPEILTASVREGTEDGERSRICFVREPGALTFEALTQRVFEGAEAGPHLVIVNTVRTAAALASYMREAGCEVLHLSTALAPVHREAIVERVKERLHAEGDKRWALIATSCVEAGLDFSFGSGWREESSVTSVVQAGGRVNRHGNVSRASVHVFRLDDAGATRNPALKIPILILEKLFANGDMERLTASELCTKALRLEIAEAAEVEHLKKIAVAESQRNFPEVARSIK